MGITVSERLTTSGLENLRTAAVLEFTEEVFESGNYRSLEVLTSEQHQLFIVNRNDRTLTILSIDSKMNVTKETLFTERIISMKEYFEDYSLVDNTAPGKIEVVFMGGRVLEIEPRLSLLHDKNYKDPEISNQMHEDFELLIAALKSTLIL
ncbi:hypothetical protein GCM10010954_18710 [Halobacillus andaensis]|uniref:Uncharacterized protein n=1 Tax=Halobacillus andaensis TaxID=1176239 RepID=A0A917B5I6_HALAA|nr:hypothetical protein [Halobacillus andaensis]MBP2004626.1 hypothetical protein [Halobacillus andaensis]GGF20200.1 hypothetical protein GCM10010954_18710 [Halobacillus andaensis]